MADVTRAGAVRAAWILLALTTPWLAACDDELEPGERTVVLEWLSCQECVDGERERVRDSVGAAALPFLAEVLESIPADLEGNADAVYRAEARQRGVQDEEAYVARRLANFRATLRRRAAIALADQGDVATLEAASSQGVQRGYRPDVLRVVRRELERARGGGVRSTADVETVAVRPALDTVEVGGSVGLEAIVQDTDGVVMEDVAVSWTSSDPGVATADSIGPLSASVTGVGDGTVDVTATVGGVAGSAVVVVVPAAPPGRVLVDSVPSAPVPAGDTVVLRARVVDAAGDGVGAGTSITWTVTSGTARFVGAGTATDTTVQTGAGGVALVRVVPSPGRNQVRASAYGATPAFFVFGGAR